MWKITLACNVLMLVLFWMLAMMAIAPAHNQLVVYAETDLALPMLTDFAIRTRFLSGFVPVTWALLAIPVGRWLGKQNDSKRIEGLMAHVVASIVVGLVLLFMYGLAGVLPVLKIGASLN